MVKVKLCLGSSCFARGNGDMLRYLQDYIVSHQLQVELSGCRCTNCCSEGPNVFIDGKKYSGVSPQEAADLIKSACAGE